ncbi:tumor necrosis factor receptor superfamily member 25 [Ahaetulla prasina]|uniref:tumor necrosis factor receptor superfamily member 25 n=1 Tax=Ahaetulla prasina TaxID=499056 RepID=UPI002649B807|nr:tumor necrosis factor receptor superfamily member 25 [Ahaetulla prasina]
MRGGGLFMHQLLWNPKGHLVQPRTRGRIPHLPLLSFYQIFLVSLLLFSAGSQVLDGVKDARKIFREVEGSAFRRKKSLRSIGSENHSNPGPSSSRPADSAAKPVPCPIGKYHYDSDNCSECKSCTGTNTISVRECRDNQDTECGCAEGYFDELNVPNLLSCKKCTNCSFLGRETLQACRRDTDAECGSCFAGFCESGETCGPCPTPQSIIEVFTPTMAPDSLTTSISKNEQCNMVCKIAVGACGCISMLAGALVLYFKKRKITSVPKSIPAANSYISKPHFGSPVSSLPETVLLMDKGPPPSRSLQQGRNLYTVINAVPVRRWKEFVRGLGLQDGEIELVELEHSQFREQQYEMLKRWCQQRGASLEAILDTLEAMQLGGCAQELREKLQVEHLWRNS